MCNPPIFKLGLENRVHSIQQMYLLLIFLITLRFFFGPVLVISSQHKNPGVTVISLISSILLVSLLDHVLYWPHSRMNGINEREYNSTALLLKNSWLTHAYIFVDNSLNFPTVVRLTILYFTPIDERRKLHRFRHA